MQILGSILDYNCNWLAVPLNITTDLEPFVLQDFLDSNLFARVAELGLIHHSEVAVANNLYDRHRHRDAGREIEQRARETEREKKERERERERERGRER